MGAAMNGGGSADECPVVFVSYSREDAEWQRKFVQMLKPLVRRRRLEVWSDERGVVGEEWRPQLKEAIGRSQAALLLVSPDFLASDFIFEQELPALINKGALLVCVLLRPSLWDEEPALERVQWAHDPRRDGPVAESSSPDGQIVRVCKKLLELLPGDGDELPEMVIGGRGGLALPVTAQAVPLAAGARPGELYGVPPLPSAFVAREELTGLREAVLSAGDGAVGVTGKPLGLRGEGGIGKTVLAAALARDDAVRSHFPDGVFWMTVGERGDLVAAQIDLLGRLGFAHPKLSSVSEGVALLREALADRRCLLIVDDVWSIAAAAAFRAAGPRARVLYTTRDPAVLDGVGADIERIGVLSVDAARELLRSLTRVQVLPAEADRILEATGRVALALALVGAAIDKGGRSWQQAIEELERSEETFLDHPYADTFKALEVAVGTLSPTLRDRYRSLVVYPQDTRVPIAAVERWWAHRHGLDRDLTHETLEKLADAQLLVLEDDSFAFHDLQREFLLLHTESVRELHGDMLSAYRALLPPFSPRWRELPPDEPYIWEHALEHLSAAGDLNGAHEVATDLGYLARRTFHSGTHAAEGDVRRAAELDPDDAAVAWVLRWMSQWGHLLNGLERIEDVAATFATRTSSSPAGVDAAGLRALLPRQLLRPLWGLPDAPDALIRVLEGNSGEVSAVAFSPDGGTLASAGSDRTVRLWDPATGAQTAVLEGHGGAVRAVAFSPDGRLLASAGSDRAVRLWDAATGALTNVLEGNRLGVWAVAFSPDGGTLASAGSDRTVRLWDPATGAQTAVLEGHGGAVRAVAFSPDGKIVASGARDRTVRLWDADSGAQLAVLRHGGGVWAMAFSPDGDTVASAGGDRTVRLWDLATRVQRRMLVGHSDSVWAVAFSRDGRMLASAGSLGGNVRLWDPMTGAQIGILEGHSDWLRAVAFSPRGILASAGDDKTVRLWNPTTDALSRVHEGHRGWVWAVAFSPDGRTLASGAADGTVRLWDPATGAQTGVLEGHRDAVSAIAFSPGGMLASAGGDRTVRLWDPATGAQTGVLEGHRDAVSAIAFSPEAGTLASASGDGTLRLWHPATGLPPDVLEISDGWVWAVAFSPDGDTVATAGDDKTVRLWNPATCVQTGVLEGHDGGVSAVAYSPDGRALATAGHDRTVRLWNAATQELTAVFKGHSDAVSAVAFAPDHRTVVSAGLDGTVRLWDAASATQPACMRLGVRAAALAVDDRGIAIGFDRTVAYMLISSPEDVPG